MQIIRVFATVATMAATASAQACPAVNSSYGFYGANSATAAAAARLDGEGLCTPIIQPVNDVCVQCRPAAIPICNCPQGYSCAQGDAYPQCVICAPGHFCPRNGGGRPVLCPEGHYCPQGSWFPLPCDALSYCPPGSSRYISLSAIIVAVIVTLCCVALAVYHWRSTRPVSSVARTTTSKGDTGDSSSSGSREENPAAEAGPETLDGKTQDSGASAVADDSSTAATPAASTAIDVSPTPSAALVPRFGWAKAIPLEVKFEHIRVDVRLGIGKGSKTILSDATGHVRPGSLTAIIGPSGAGKTTILNVLRGRIENLSGGQLWVNGAETRITKFKKLVGVVPQDDVMHRDLTVSEILWHSAHTRLPRSWPAKAKSAMVDDVIRELGLQEVRHRIIGDELHRGISGGQRKRVNIGVELVANCTLLLLDEPTSGLDATAAEDCMNIIRRISQKGITVAAVVHQPRDEIWRLFDTVLVLGVGGRTVYFGPRKAAAAHFEHLWFARPEWVSEPDFILDAVSGVLEREGAAATHDPENLAAEWARHQLACATSETSEAASFPEVDLFPTFTAPARPALTARYVLRKIVKSSYSCMFRNFSSAPAFACVGLYMLESVQQTSHTLKSLVINCTMFAFTGVYIGVCFFQPKYRLPLSAQLAQDCPTPILQMYEGLAIDTEGDPNAINVRNFCSTCTPSVDQVGQMAFYVGMGVGVIASAASIHTFGDVRKMVYWREASAGANRVAYFVGRDLVDVVKCGLFTLSFTSVFVLLAAPLGSFATYGCLVMAHIYCTYGIGYVASVPLSFMNASMLAVIASIVLMITSGFVFRIQKLGLIAWVAHPRWFGEAMFATEVSALGDATFESLVPGNGTVVVRSSSLQGSIALYADARYGYATDRLGFDVFMMVMCGLALRCIALALLLLVRRDMQR